VWSDDGSVVKFVVQDSATVPKASFPSRQVYGPIPYPGLRLITCGGPFDGSTGHYVDNVIVFAQAIY
jgi:hypothetical protein